MSGNVGRVRELGVLRPVELTEPPVRQNGRNGGPGPSANVDRVRLRCTSCGEESQFGRGQEPCRGCGSQWLDLAYHGVGREDLISDHDALGRQTLWRYRNFLPIDDERNIVSMGEGATPLLRVDRFGERLGLQDVYIKDERPSATGSFKDRAASLCVSKWVELGVREMALSSTGNVAASFATYSARAGIRLWIFMPEKVNSTKFTEVMFSGHNVIEVKGNYDQAGVLAKKFGALRNMPADPGVRNPLRREAMKTLAYEIAEDLGWRSPDWYIQAVSGGIGPLGVWKGFRELKEMGVVDRIPRIACVQAAGCAPMARAFELDTPEIMPVQPNTEIETLTTGRPEGYPVIYEAVKSSGGHICCVGDDEAFAAQELLTASEGVFAESAAAVAVAGLMRMASEGVIKPHESVVCVCSGKGLRDIDFVRRRMRHRIFMSVPGDCEDLSVLHREPGSEGSPGKPARSRSRSRTRRERADGRGRNGS